MRVVKFWRVWWFTAVSEKEMPDKTAQHSVHPILRQAQDRLGVGAAFFERFSGFGEILFRGRIHAPAHQRVTQTVGRHRQ
jgi:hypothetical protein